MPLFALHPLWQWIFWVSYATWALFEIWVFSRDRRAVGGENRDRGSLRVIIFLLVLGLFIAFTAPHFLRFARIHLAAGMMFFPAIALIWCGMMFRLWAIRTLGHFFRTSVVMQDEHHLVTVGPYHLLRHPAYTGTLVTLTGIGLSMGNWVSLSSAVVCGFAAYAWRIQIEERALRARFGQIFEQNKARTWAVIPFVW